MHILVFILLLNSSALISDSTTKCFVIEHQPYLLIEDGAEPPSMILFKDISLDDFQYILYLYVWEFSNTPWIFEILGYSDHPWDYEPIIVVHNKTTGEIVECIYDSGHYRASISTSMAYEVTPDAHYFIPHISLDDNQEYYQGEADNFYFLTESIYVLIEDKLQKLPRVPFGRPLSLDWAIHNPERVKRIGSFSTDSRDAKIPLRLYFIVAVLAILLAIVLHRRITKNTNSI